MGMTAEQAQALLITMDKSGTTLIEDNIDVLWAIHEDKGSIDVYYQYLYVAVECIDLLTMNVWTQVDIDGKITSEIKLGQIKDNLAQMRQNFTDKIAAYEKQSDVGSSYAGYIGQITTVAPRSNPNASTPDGNQPKYRGDLYE